MAPSEMVARGCHMAALAVINQRITMDHETVEAEVRIARLKAEMARRAAGDK